MELRAIKVQLLKEDQEPEFNEEQFQEQKTIEKDPELRPETPFKTRIFLNSSKMSQGPNSNKSHISSILNSPEKGSGHSLKKKYSQFQSISPEKSNFKSRFNFHRPVFSANKNQKANANKFVRGQIAFQRTSYSPTISPQRKSTYWQTWLLPMNSTMRDSTAEQPPKITAQSYCVMMADTNQILACQDVNSERQVASLTKVMTAYTALNICSTFGIKIRQHYISINRQAAYMNGTSAGLKPDEEILIIDLIYALLLPSGNDAGIAIAQYFGKFLSYKFAQDMKSNQKEKTSMDKFKQFKQYYDSEYDKQSIKLFVFEMNKNCHRIGLKNTHFNNSTGLSDKKNYSSAKDMAILSGHCFKNHTLRMMFKKKFHICEVKNSRLCQQRQIQWKNTNRHLFQFRQCIGSKTGITPNAGPCLSSAYKVMGRQLIVIVLQCQSVQSRYKDAEALFKWCRKKVRAF